MMMTLLMMMTIDDDHRGEGPGAVSCMCAVVSAFSRSALMSLEEVPVPSA